MSSIIETVYGERIADRLCAAIEALGAATAAYQTTGTDQLFAQEQRDTTAGLVQRREDVLMAYHSTAIESGKNEMQRRLIAERLLGEDAMLLNLREEMRERRTAALHVERAHKNAAAEMLSLRVAIGGYAAVLGATKEGR